MDNRYKEEIKKARKQLVAQRNDFIQETRYSLGIMQSNIFRYMLSKIKPTDTPDTEYEYKYKEMFTVLQYKSNTYTKIKEVLKGMNSLSFWRRSLENASEEELVSLFQSDSIKLNVSKGSFYCKFGKKIWPYIMELQKQQKEQGIHFTATPLQMTIFMKKHYSARIYDLLASHMNTGRWTFEVGTGSDHDLQLLIADYDSAKKTMKVPKSWSNWAVFKRDVIEPALKDINEGTDLSVIYKVSKRDLANNSRGKYCSIEFIFKKKDEQELVELDKKIDERYEKYYETEFRDDDDMYHQISIEEFQNSIESEKKEKHGNDRDIQTEIQEPENSKKDNNEPDKADEELLNRLKEEYPLSLEASGVSSFKPKQLKALLGLAKSKIDRCSVNKENYDIWITDYISYYMKKIDATPEETVVSTYSRLYNYVNNDWDKMKNIIDERYRFRKVKINDTMTEIERKKLKESRLLSSDEKIKKYMEHI